MQAFETKKALVEMPNLDISPFEDSSYLTQKPYEH